MLSATINQSIYIKNILPADNLLYYNLFCTTASQAHHGGRRGMFSLIHFLATLLKTVSFVVFARLVGIWLYNQLPL